jgi:hypothetical protein
MAPATDNDWCSSHVSSPSRNIPDTKMEQTDETQGYIGDHMEMETTYEDDNKHKDISEQMGNCTGMDMMDGNGNECHDTQEDMTNHMEMDVANRDDVLPYWLQTQKLRQQLERLQRRPVP